MGVHSFINPKTIFEIDYVIAHILGPGDSAMNITVLAFVELAS